MAQDEVKKEEILFSKCCDEWLELKKTLVKESSYFNYIKAKINKIFK